MSFFTLARARNRSTSAAEIRQERAHCHFLSMENIIVGIIALVLFIYLVAMLRPEKF